ncbi:MAG: response regulator [Treponema sp.]|nr:response regulator [Treponema sp.]
MEKSNIDIDKRLAFFANTVHEIRTPVQTIIGMLDLLLDTNLNNEQQEYVRQIQFSTNVLLALINDILDFSKIKSQQISLESIPYDVIAITERIVDFVSIEAFSKGIELVVDADYTLPQLISGDPTRVQQILLNIIKNAVKFTPTGYVHLELSLKDTSILLFQITDSGIGIPEQKQQELFNDYYQADASTARKYGGSGLGLAICKGLVKAMNGTIGVRPNPEGGSIFWFTIPLIAAHNLPAENTAIAVNSKTRFLIVDDSPLAANSLRRKLNSFGLYDIEYAENAEQSLLKMQTAVEQKKPFAVVFIDMSLPKVNGWHLAWEIKERKVFSTTKRYLLVSEGQMGEEAKMKLINLFDGYIYKPIKRNPILLLLKDLFDTPDELETVAAENIDTQTIFDTRNETISVHGLTVLVADDHPLNRKLLATFLKKFGANVIEAENGKKAVSCIMHVPEIVMIFMDVQMPEMDGIEASQKIRELGYTGIIIACTANNDKNDFALYRNTGMNDILVKPFKQVDVKEFLEKWHTVIELPAASKIATLDALTAPTNSTWNQKDFENTIDDNFLLGKELIEDYRKQTALLMQQAEQAIDRKDFDELRRIGHKLKGSSLAISATALAQCGERIDEQAKQSDIESIRKMFHALKDELTIFEISADKWQKKRFHRETSSMLDN